MKKLEYQVSFTTPAFLGNAEQVGQWRTPPFKALLRQWWRVAHAPKVDYDVARLRRDEAKLFGSASDDGEVKSHQSLVRLRLSHWDDGAMSQWPAGGRTVSHPEIKFLVGSDLYLGFGPIKYDRATKSPMLGTSKSSDQKRTAIDDKAKVTLSLMLPNDCEAELCAAMQLAAWFGTVGSRSRNGWGALQMAHDHIKLLTRADLESLGVTRQLSECLDEEWPHAIGKDDEGPLVWKTKVIGDWRAVMKELAKIKIAFRTQFTFNNGGAGAQIDKRHILAYPITNHNLNAWGGQERLANQIRFKLAKTAAGNLEGVIVHLPCKLPDELVNKLSQSDQQFIRKNELAAWKAVHAVLDQQATRLV